MTEQQIVRSHPVGCSGMPFLYHTRVTFLSLLLLGCANYAKESGLTPDARKTIEIPLHESVAIAAQRVLTASARNGWTVTATSPGVVTVGPYKYDPTREVTLHANIVGSDSSSTIIVSGTYVDSFFGGSAIQPITESIHGRTEQMWKELQRFAQAVRSQ